MSIVVSQIDRDVDHHLASHSAPAQSAVPAPGASTGVPGTSAHYVPTPPAAEQPGIGGGVASNWWNGLSASVHNLVQPQPPPKPQTKPQQAVAAARRVQAVVGSIMGVLSMPGDLLNTGFANLTAPLAKVMPSLPAATITSMYLGLPHTHNHPPSLVPPAPPIPLPSIGAVLLGTSVKVLINNMPAARCGDIGLAPTCCGFTPFFQIKTGSSNVFIGGTRAARLLDICRACATADDRPGTINAGKIMGAIGAIARGIQAVQGAMGYISIGMDLAEAAVEDDAALQSAKAMAAAMAAAQMAADAAAKALSKTMGKDAAGIPPIVIGAITVGHPNVLIGGFPMVNIPNPAELLLKRLARYKTKPQPPPRPPGHCGTKDCD